MIEIKERNERVMKKWRKIDKLRKKLSVEEFKISKSSEDSKKQKDG